MEQGTQEELLAQTGIYRTLASNQRNLSGMRRRLEATVGVGAMSGIEAVIGSDDDEEAFLSSSSPDCRSAYDTLEKETPERDDDEVQWLDPNTMTIEGDRQGTLRLISAGKSVSGVYAVRAFPTDYAQQYLSLRHREQARRPHEAGMIDSLDRWPRAAKEAINRSLGRRYLLRRILEIRQIRTSENVLALSVSTDSGPAAIRLEKPGKVLSRLAKTVFC